jgi:hypothetical protein
MANQDSKEDKKVESVLKRMLTNPPPPKKEKAKPEPKKPAK